MLFATAPPYGQRQSYSDTLHCRRDGGSPRDRIQNHVRWQVALVFLYEATVVFDSPSPTASSLLLLLLLLLLSDRSSPECFDVRWTRLSPERYLSDVV